MALQALAVVVQHGEPLGKEELSYWTGECYCDQMDPELNHLIGRFHCDNCDKDYDFICRGKLRTKLAGCCKKLHKLNRKVYRPE